MTEAELADDSVYRRLQEHLDKTPIGFPAAESDADIRLLKYLFTPEEALIATFLTYWHRAVDDLETIFDRAKDVGITIEALEEVLDRMASKGLVHFKVEEGTKFYNNAQWMVGIYELQIGRMTEEFIKLSRDYNRDAYGKALFTARPKQFRIIPVQKSFSPESPVANYDNIRELIETADAPFMVMHCICREIKKIHGKPCKVTEREETCIGSGPFAKMFISNGWGREISKDELMELIEQAQSEGLVLQPSNSEKFEFICSCCGCCCGLLRGKGAMPKPVELFTTNYRSEVDHDLCSQCGTCVDLCQMKALSFQDDLLVINLDRCIGCGVCVANCPEGAITLKKHEKEFIPPKTMEETYNAIQANK
ncbi:MAG: 4Fe-4S dicluster domain-containing protein [Promethearchaeota archaeon]